MFNSIKSIVTNGQFWLRLALGFLIPFLLFSSIMDIASDSINEELGGDEKPRVALLGEEDMPVELLTAIKNQATVIKLASSSEIEMFLEEDSLDVGLVFPAGFYSDSSYKGEVDVYYNSMQNSNAVKDVLDIIDSYEDQIVANKIEALGLDKQLVNPIVLEKINTFSAMMMLGRIMEQIRGALSNVLNLLFILFVIWLSRNLILRAEYDAESSFGNSLVVIFAATILATAVVFLGFQTGVNPEVEGLVRGLILSIQQLLTWNKLSAILWLWWPTWLFIIGLLGCIASYSRTEVSAYSRTFWAAMIIHIIAIAGLIPIEEMGMIKTLLPIANIFGAGQLAMKDVLDPSTWWLAFGATTVWAVLIILLWYKLKNKKE